MGILFNKINEKINSLNADFETNKVISHQGVKGSFNESALLELIKDVIPSKYQLTKGLIENTKGEASHETDIIIYDNEILPAYIKNDLSFVPIEAVKYIFEVKSALSSTELKTTITKFNKYQSMGGKSPTVLFAFSSDINGNEFTRYCKNDPDFLINPSINVLCVSSKCYYFKVVEEYYLKDFYSTADWLKLTTSSLGINVENVLEEAEAQLSNNIYLDQLSRSDFATTIQKIIQLKSHKQNLGTNNLKVNDVDFSDIKFRIHKWIGFKQECTTNNIILSLLSGISNTLSKGNLGNYLISTDNSKPQLCAICFEDMWGNISSEYYSEEGLSYDASNFSFTYESTGDTKKHKISFSIKRD